MFKFFEPNKIFSITSRAPKYVIILFIVVLTIGLIESLILSPEDYKQSHSVRIMYVHVPAAWISLGIFSGITLLSILGYIFKIKNFFLISKSLAPSGFIFNLIALVTGSIWGKPTWGTWWVWDARLTSTLILLILYLAIISLFSSFDRRASTDQAVSIVVLIGGINLPIIKLSVEWWNTLHQSASITLSGSSIDNEMLIPLLISIFGFYLYVTAIGMRKMQVEILKREISHNWVKEIFKEKR